MKIYVDKDGNRVNTHAAIVHDGVVYNGNVLQFPAVVAAMGIREAMVEVEPPGEYTNHPEFYAVNELDRAPYLEYNRKSDEQIAAIERATTNALAEQYLASTDWYVIRCMDDGTPVPEEIRTARANARASIVR